MIGLVLCRWSCEGRGKTMEFGAAPRTRPPLEALAAQTFSRITEARRVDGNTIRLLRDGSENYPLWLEAIAAAQTTVHLENYFIEEDEVGHCFADALAGAARRGLRVRVLYDWLGCKARTSRQFWNRLESAGVEVRSYNPPRLDNPLGWISRDHRKLLCLDGQLAFAGGLCIGHDWKGDAGRGVAAWRDTALEIRGPAVLPLESAFADSWAAAGPPLPPGQVIAPRQESLSGAVPVWVIAGKPGSMGLYRLEQVVAEFAERSLWLSDAYFVATTAYVRALCGAARNGVDVRLLVPGSSNFPAVQGLSRLGYRPLLAAGVRVFEWNGPMMHAKTAVADGCWSRIGSSNSNISSWIANRELDLVVDDAGFAKEMEAMYELDLENATEMIFQSGRIHAAGATHPSAMPPRVRRTASAGRLIAGTVGFASAVGASLSQKRPVGPTEGYILAAAGAILLGLALVAATLPRLIAYPIAALGAWIGLTLVIRAYKLRVAARVASSRERP